MEKALSADERIRRAEELYYRKRSREGRKETARVNVSEKKNYYKSKRMILQIIICIFLYSILYLIQTTNYAFSGDVIAKTKEILAYDMDFPNIYKYVEKHISNFVFIKQDDLEKEEEQPEKVPENEPTEETILENEPVIEEDGLGGEDVEMSLEEQHLTEMEYDAKYIFENYYIEAPITGTITSRFGNRIPMPPIVSKYHTGIDIAAVKGTVITAAMSGTVKLVSSFRWIWETCKNSKWRCFHIICAL